MLFRKIKKYIEDIGFTICKNSEQEGFFIVESDADSIRNLIIGGCTAGYYFRAIPVYLAIR